MKATEKAASLIVKFSAQLPYYTKKDNMRKSVICALVCVEEIIDQWKYIDTYLADLRGELNPNLKYWYEVKEELLKL